MTAMRAPRPAQGGVGLQWPTPLGRSTAPEARNVRATPQDLRGLGCSGGRCGGRVASTVGGGGSAQSRFLASALQRGPADHVEAPVRRGHATGQMRIGGQVCGGPTVQAAPLRIGTAAAGGALTRLGGWGGEGVGGSGPANRSSNRVHNEYPPLSLWPLRGPAERRTEGVHPRGMGRLQCLRPRPPPAPSRRSLPRATDSAPTAARGPSHTIRSDAPAHTRTGTPAPPRPSHVPPPLLHPTPRTHRRTHAIAPGLRIPHRRGMRMSNADGYPSKNGKMGAPMAKVGHRRGACERVTAKENAINIWSPGLRTAKWGQLALPGSLQGSGDSGGLLKAQAAKQH